MEQKLKIAQVLMKLQNHFNKSFSRKKIVTFFLFIIVGLGILLYDGARQKLIYKVETVYGASCGCWPGCCPCCCDVCPDWPGGPVNCDTCPSPPTPTPTPTNTPTPTPTPSPTPTLRPCSPELEIPEYKCNEDETAQVTWKWNPRGYPALSYLLQVAFDKYFDNLEMETEIGSINTYTDLSINNPNTMRFSRVIVSDSGGLVCSTGGTWEWSNTTSTRKNCSSDEGEGEEPPAVNFLDELFCNSFGEPTDNPQSGEIFTAIGCVPVKYLQLFTEFSLKWGIGIAGGIAFLLVVYGGYLYMTSRGDPRKVQAAKELLTAAVGGLLFLIFSATIMRIISSDVLHLPGTSVPLCNTPTTASASVACDGPNQLRIEFTWTPLSGHGLYVFEYDDSGTCTFINGEPDCDFANAKSDIVNGTSYTLSPATQQVPHFFRVRPMACDETLWSQTEATVGIGCN